MYVKERLKKYLTHIDMSENDFEGKCGLSRGFVSKDRDCIRKNNLLKIQKAFPDINIIWLQTGEGQMLNQTIIEPTIIYHYTDLKGFLGIISSGYIRLSDLSNANDRCEVFNRSGYKYASFCMDGDVKGCLNPCMWTHYGDEYLGICIGFNLSKLKEINKGKGFMSFPIQYKGIEEIKNNTSDECGLKYKLSVWNYENEYRFIHESNDILSFNYECITEVYVPKEINGKFRDMITSVGLNGKTHGIWFVGGLPEECFINDPSLDMRKECINPIEGFNNPMIIKFEKKKDCSESEGRSRAKKYLEELNANDGERTRNDFIVLNRKEYDELISEKAVLKHDVDLLKKRLSVYEQDSVISVAEVKKDA